MFDAVIDGVLQAGIPRLAASLLLLERRERGPADPECWQHGCPAGMRWNALSVRPLAVRRHREEFADGSQADYARLEPGGNFFPT
jgi:hypothetical protein